MRIFGNLRTKIILLYLLLAVIPIVVISGVSIAIYGNVASRIEGSLLDYSAAQTGENLSAKMAALRKIVAQVVTSPEVIALYPVFENAEPFTTEAATTRNSLANQFSNFAQMDSYIMSIALITNQLDAAVYDRYDTTYIFPSRWNNKKFREAFLAETANPDAYQINVESAVNFSGAPANVNRHIYFTFPAMDFISRKTYGIIVIEVDNTALNSILDLRGSDRRLDIFISPSSCITNQDGTILTAPDRTLVGTNFSSLDATTAKGFSTKTLLVKGTDFNLNLIFDNGALRQNTDRLRNLVFLVTLAITGIFALIVFIVTGRMQRRSNRIAAAISSFRENQQDVDVVIDEHDEIFYVIANQFNQMTSDITAMVSELRAKNEHIASATNQRRKAEIRALQAQINPHFLYNALDRINWMAIDNEQQEISEMLAGLASLLRYSVSNIDVLVPLKAEIQWMEKYLFIQGKRFDREIEFDCSVYGDAIDFPIYKMLLQPLVENSILHGFMMRPNGNRIRLDAHILDDARLRLVLSDNGLGIDEKKLASIRAEIAARRAADRPADDMDDVLPADEGGIGISNVVDRLWLYYGREGDIQVESVFTQGTSFILTIPYREHA